MDKLQEYWRTPQPFPMDWHSRELYPVEDQSQRPLFAGSPLLSASGPYTLKFIPRQGTPSPDALSAPRTPILTSKHVISKKVAFDGFDEDSIQKTPEKKQAKENQLQTTAQKKYTLRANTPYIGPTDKQQNEGTLRVLAKEALDVVERRGPSSYKEVSEKIVEQRIVKTGQIHEKEEKNIKRRVYDALNVMIATKKLYKRNKKILADARRTQMLIKNKEKLKERKNVLIQKKNMVEQKKALITILKRHKSCVDQLQARNQKRLSSHGQVPLDRINLPFLVAKNVNLIHFQSSQNLYLTFLSRSKAVLGDIEAITSIFH